MLHLGQCPVVISLDFEPFLQTWSLEGEKSLCALAAEDNWPIGKWMKFARQGLR